MEASIAQVPEASKPPAADVKDEPKPLPVPVKWVVSAAAAVTSVLIGSLFGDTGTLIGTAVGSILSGAAAAGYEYVIVKSSRKLKRVGPLGAVQHPAGKFPWRKVAIVGAATVAITELGVIGVVLVTEEASGQTLHGVVTQSHDYGTSFSHSTVQPSITPAPAYSPSFSPSPSPSPSSSSPSPSASTTPELPTQAPSSLEVPTPTPSPVGSSLGVSSSASPPADISPSATAPALAP
jgi:hypothetical protein